MIKQAVVKMNFTLMVIMCLAQFPKAYADQLIIYKLTNLECITNIKRATNETCLVKAQNWNKAVAYMDVDLVIPIRNVVVRLEVLKKGYSNRYHPFLINVTVNMCDVIAKRNFLPYGMIFWKMLREYTNVNHSCPLSGHLLARNFYINEKYLPIEFPLGFYMIVLNIDDKVDDRAIEHVGIIKYYFESKEMVKAKQRKRI